MPKITQTITIPPSGVKPNISSTQCKNSLSSAPDKEPFTEVWTAAECVMKLKHSFSSIQMSSSDYFRFISQFLNKEKKKNLLWSIFRVIKNE